MIDLSKFISKKYNTSVRQSKKMIKSGCVLIDKTPVYSKDIHESQLPYITLKNNLPALNYKLEDFLVKETNETIFFYKPPFMHTSRITPFDKLTMEDIACHSFPEYRLISRLDFETDGIIPAVKKNRSYKTKKKYLAFIEGKMNKNITISNTIDASKRKKVKVLESINGNKTEISPIKYTYYKNNIITLISIELEEAARHQIRAYCSYVGYPILGDSLYGAQSYKRLLLHCNYTEIWVTEKNTLNSCSSPYCEIFINTFSNK